MTSAADDPLISNTKLLTFGKTILGKLDVPQEHAALTSRILLEADLRGVASHGMAHLVDFYVRRMQREKINPQPQLKLDSDQPSAATLDADNGLGFVAGHHAMSLAIDKAQTTGIGWVSVGNSTHYGAGAYYAMMALEHDMIGFSMSTGGRLVAPPGGLGRAIGLNVLSVAAPTSRDFPYVLDMATSVVAAGKLEIAGRRGEAIPEGWAQTSTGEPLTDPAKLHPDSTMLPLGGTPVLGAFKGFGLTIMVDILTGALSGFGTSAEIDSGLTAAHCFGAMRIEAFQPLADYKERMEQMIVALKATPKREGVDEIMIPGEPEHALAEQRRADGRVPVHPRVLAGYRDAAEELDVTYDLEEE
jgi:LDH2 family malate/lactate/ureidoglycolate dehydrogenase